MKIEDVKSEEGRTYVRAWVKALDVLLGWSEEQTLAWAEKLRAHLDDENALLFHWGPHEYLVRLIIPEKLNEALDADEKFELRKLLLSIIERNGSFSCKKPNFNWHLAKRLIARVLKQVGLLKISGGKNVGKVLRSKRRKLEARMRSGARRRSKISEKDLRKILREACG